MHAWTGMMTGHTHTLVLFSKMSIPLSDRKRCTLLFFAAFSEEYLSAVLGMRVTFVTAALKPTHIANKSSEESQHPCQPFPKTAEHTTPNAKAFGCHVGSVA